MKNNLMLMDPELSFDNLHKELNNFLRDTFLDSALSVPMGFGKNSNWRPAVEIKQNEKEYKVKVQLPGVNKEDIHVELDNDLMKISAEINEEKNEKSDDDKLQTSEFRYGKYVRTIAFDHPIKSDESVAEYKNGILNITMPKQKIQKTHTKRLNVK